MKKRITSLLIVLVFAVTMILPNVAFAQSADPSANPPVTEQSTALPEQPSAEVSTEPTVLPSEEPTVEPTAQPTVLPSEEPTIEPTVEPTVEPPVEPTTEPTAEPIVEPTDVPTAEPSAQPSAQPTAAPSVSPSPDAMPDDMPMQPLVGNYNASDVAAIQAFLVQADAQGETNAQKLGYIVDAPGTWFNIAWDMDGRITEIFWRNISGRNIQLVGNLDLRACAALTSLNIDGVWDSINALQSIDVSGLTALTELQCWGNRLNSLNVSGCTALTDLDCRDNQLTSLNVSSNTALTDLWCSDNQLTSLNVSSNTALTDLWCSDNQLTSLNASSNTALTDLDCSNNQLTSLNVSSNMALIDLDCSNNQLTNLDVSNNTALTSLSCESNPLVDLDLSKNTALNRLSCGNHAFSQLMWNQDLRFLDCSKMTRISGQFLGKPVNYIAENDEGFLSIGAPVLSLYLTARPKSGYEFVGFYDEAGNLISNEPSLFLKESYVIGGFYHRYAVAKFARIGSVQSISLNKSATTLTVGASETLTATVAPANATNKAVAWSSSNPAVASVTNGTVKANAPGTATITVTTADGNKTAGCVVTVKAATVPVTGVSLNKSATTLTVGASETLTATVAPASATNKAVTWSSSNPAVASVANGTVTANAPGTATITVATADGNKTAGCTVTITQPVTKLMISPSKSTIGKGRSLALSLDVLPANASNQKVTWSSSNPKIAKVDSKGVVKGLAKGKVTITATAQDGSGKVAKCTIAVNPSLRPITGMKLNAKTFKTYVGKTATLKATVAPGNATNRALTWESSNENVATVNSKGRVVAVNKGSAIITAKATDGSGKKVSCKITVIQPVKKVTLPSRATVKLKKTVTLKATVAPANASSKKLVWKSSNPQIAAVSSKGVVKGLKKGTVYIYATAADGSKVQARCKVSVK